MSKRKKQLPTHSVSIEIYSDAPSDYSGFPATARFSFSEQGI